jgi:hypothetical protein
MHFQTGSPISATEPVMPLAIERTSSAPVQVALLLLGLWGCSSSPAADSVDSAVGASSCNGKILYSLQDHSLYTNGVFPGQPNNGWRGLTKLSRVDDFSLLDMDGDGRSDLVTTKERDLKSDIGPFVLYQSKKGVFDAAARPISPLEWPGVFRGLGDVDGDGLPEILSASADPIHCLGSSGVFGYYIHITSNPNVEAWKTDLYASYTVSTFISGGCSDYNTTVYEGLPLAVAVAPLSGPGSRDLVTVLPNDLAVETFKQNADRSYAAGQSFDFDSSGDRTANGARPISFGDLNEDGNLDAVVAEDHGLVAKPCLSVLLGDGTSALKHSNSYTLDSTSAAQANAAKCSVLVEDFTGDGHVDALMACTTAMFLFTGDGHGNLSLATTTPQNWFADAVLIPMKAMDLNADAATDLFANLCFEDGVNCTLVVFLNDGRGNFKTSSKHIPAKNPRQDAVPWAGVGGALDAKGADVAILGYLNGLPDLGATPGDGMVLPSNGDGTFGAPHKSPCTE